jgi:UDP-GlcNAc:undecaprenyl-phosphate GlcNAc-1-phosphate transferase
MKRIANYISCCCAALLIVCLIHPGLRVGMYRWGNRWVFILILSACTSYLATPLLRWLALRFRILDVPDTRKSHKDPTPLLGGIAIYCGFVVSLFYYAVFSRALRSLLLAGTIILLVGILDDWRETSALLRLMLQILAVGIVMGSGIHFLFLPEGLLGNMAEWLLTLLWITGITNALNFLDGLDGLATGSAIIIAFYLGVVAFQSGQPCLGWALVAIIGGCLGFLPYNLRLHSATIFLGDAGSTFLGFMLASLAVMGNWGPDNLIKTFTPPLLIFGLLIFDLFHITISRIASGKVSTFKGWIDFVGRDHLHHRLESLGMTKKEVVMFIFLFQICLGAGALLIRQIHEMQAVLLLLQSFGIIALFAVLEHLGNVASRERNETTDRDCVS